MNYEYEIWTNIYDQFNHGRHEKEREFYRQQLCNIPGAILEIACGTGMILLDYLKAGHRQTNEIASQRQNITWRFTTATGDIETTMLIRWIYHEEFKLFLRLAN